MADPLVSIVVPAYNHELYIGEMLRSLIAQTYRQAELVILNDGSTDGTANKIAEISPELSSRFLRYVFTEHENQGVAKTLNRGVDLANGDFLFFAASDDVFEPSAIERLMEVALSDADLGLVCADADFIDEAGRKISLTRDGQRFESFVRYNTVAKPDFELGRDFGTYRSFLSWNYIPPGLLIRKSFFRLAGGFDEATCVEDYDLWLKMSKHCRFRLINTVYGHYRIHATNTVTKHHLRLFRDVQRLMVREAEHAIVIGLRPDWERFMHGIADGLYEEAIALQTKLSELEREYRNLDGKYQEVIRSPWFRLRQPFSAVKRAIPSERVKHVLRNLIRR